MTLPAPNLLERLGMSLPVVQAPMAGVSTPQMAAAVSEAGGLGSIAIGASGVAAARTMIEAVRGLTDRPFNVNVFVHADPEPEPEREVAWLDALKPRFAEFGAEPPPRIGPIYRSFAHDDDALRLLVETAPAVVSFHFGLPSPDRIAALHAAGIILFASATSLAEAEACVRAGIDVVVAQGWEAGGHRGVFDPEVHDDRLGTFALTRLLAGRCGVPVIAAGGIMDGQGVRAALDLGAVAAQLGTAFIACPESSADAAYRALLAGPGAHHTRMTRAISGRPARCLPNHFTAWGEGDVPSPPAYPTAYDAGKALNQVAKAAGEPGYGAQWAGQGAPFSRPMPAAELMAALKAEMAGDAGRR